MITLNNFDDIPPENDLEKEIQIMLSNPRMLEYLQRRVLMLSRDSAELGANIEGNKSAERLLIAGKLFMLTELITLGEG